MGALREVAALLKFRAVQLLALLALFATVGGSAIAAKYCVLDPDIWWHLRTGDWIVEHVAVPHTGLFTYTAAQRPWTAYSWGYEVLLSRAHAWFGLVGFGLFGVATTLLVAVVLFAVVLRMSGRFWIAWLLTSVGCYAFLFSLMPRPVFFSMALFTVMLGMIMESQRASDIRRLYWLPLLFVLWANLHIQFTYGLAVLGLFIAAHAVRRVAQRLKLETISKTFPQPILPVLPLVGVVVACVLASCVGPYSFHLFGVLVAYSKQKATYETIIELLPLNFEDISHYAEVLLAAGAFVALGWRKNLDLFQVALMTVATVVAFRTTRDAWFVCIVAVLVIADAAPSSERRFNFTVPEATGVAAALLFVLFLVCRNADFTTAGLDRKVTSHYPVNAANFIRSESLPGPLYNSFDYGGFLIWYLPDYPVSVDGRNDIYGDELHEALHETEGGERNYKEDPYLNAAGTVLLKKSVPLARLLTIDPRFRIAYRDDISVVFVRTQAAQ
jgi:hypothetical protein